jgi:cation diffusion facilitator family transporter
LQREKDSRLSVAKYSIAISAGLTLLKLTIGFSTNSLGILSDAMHSGLDIIAAFMTLYAIRMVMKPPDFRFTYGYAKVESMSSFAEIILLFVVAGWIFYEGIDRIFFRSVQPDITVVSFAIMLGSIAIDFERSRVLYRTARKFGSQALEADALHFKTDMVSSGIIVIGLALVFLYHVPNADAYAAIVVAAMIIYTSLGLGRRTLDVLLDRAPKGAYQRVVETVSGLEGVDRAHDIHVRKMGSETLVDMHIEVPRTLTHDKAHRVATAVEDRVRSALPNSDVLVHVDAIETAGETITDRVRLIAAETEGIKNVHSIYLSIIPFTSHTRNEIAQAEKETIKDLKNISHTMGKSLLHMYLDVQVDSSLDLMTAHAIVDNFEKQVKEQIPKINNITAHIETETSKNLEIGTEKRTSSSYVENIRRIALSVDHVVDCMDIGVVDINGELHITLIIKIKSSPERSITSIDEAHRLATSVQNLIVKETGASRVVIHAEPG